MRQADALSHEGRSNQGAQELVQKYQHADHRNAQALATTLQDNGFDLVTGGTDNHLMLVRLTTRA